MNRLRCFLFAAMVVLSTATFALGGEVQFPGKSNTQQPPPAPASATNPTTDGSITRSTETIQIAWREMATAMLRDILLTIY